MLPFYEDSVAMCTQEFSPRGFISRGASIVQIGAIPLNLNFMETNSIVHADFYFSLNALSMLSSFQSIAARLPRLFPIIFNKVWRERLLAASASLSGASTTISWHHFACILLSFSHDFHLLRLRCL